MALFSINNSSAKKIPPYKVELEKNIQNIFENNLNEILNINFLASEYTTSFGGRIDTLGIDNNGSPVIIEYKRNQNDSVINQGLSYLRWLLDHKAEFEALAQKSEIQIDIDWNSPRVICVAESYNKFDLDTADLLPINIELLKFQMYEQNILLVEPEAYQKVQISTSKVFEKHSREQKMLKERTQYTLEDHRASATQETRDMFDALHEKILSLDEGIIVRPRKLYIAYKLTTNFVDVSIFYSPRKVIKIWLNMPSGKLEDPYSIARDLTKPKKVGHWGNGDYEVKIEKEESIDKAFELIKQSYKYNK